MLGIFGDLKNGDVFTSRIPIFAKLILIFSYLGCTLFPFASEASPMLYENAWYFCRMEHSFIRDTFHGTKTVCSDDAPFIVLSTALRRFLRATFKWR